MTALYTTRRPRRTPYHSFLSNLDGLLRENGIRMRSGSMLPVAWERAHRSETDAPPPDYDAEDAALRRAE
jgi:hypothetical protein